MLSVVSPGTSFSIEARFLNEDGSPFAMTGAPSFNIRDFNGKLVVSGAGQQDPSVVSRWIATVSLPDTVPVDPTLRYSLNWKGQNNKNTRTITELFSVMPTTDFSFIENDRLILERGTVADKLFVPYSSTLTDVKASIKDESGNLLYETAVTTVNQVFDKKVYSFTTNPLPNLEASVVGMRPYVVEWTFLENGVPSLPEYHFLYVVNTKILLAMNDVRRLIDKARNEDINPNLAYSDVDLAHYVQQGLLKLNMYPPQVSAWTINSLPRQFTIALTYAAAWEALNARLLAEGESAFDFSGQSVSLSMDRTSSLESALGRLDSWLETNMLRSKKLWARTGSGSGNGAGVLGVQVGPSLNRIRNASTVLARIRNMASYPSYVNW